MKNILRRPRRNDSRRTRSRSLGKRQRHPTLEVLEDRHLLAAVAWDGDAGDGLWQSAVNWSNDLVPGADDDVMIDLAGDVTVTVTSAPAAVHSLTNRETLHVSGRSAGGHALLTVNDTFTNEGILRLESLNSTWRSNVTVNGSLVNTVSGTIDVNIGTGGERIFRGAMVNEGVIDIDDNVSRGNSQFLGNFTAAGGAIQGDLYFRNSTFEFTAAQPEGTEYLFVGDGNRIVGDVVETAEIWVHGNRAWSDSILVVDSVTVNHGTIRLESIDSSYFFGLAVQSSASFTNAPTGVIEINQGTNGERWIQVDGLFVHQGLIEIEETVLRGNNRFVGNFEAAGGVIAGDIDFIDSTLEFTVPQPVQNEFVLVRQGNRIVGDIDETVKLWIQGNAVWGDAFFIPDEDKVNRGTIRLESIDSSYFSGLIVPQQFPADEKCG